MADIGGDFVSLSVTFAVAGFAAGWIVLPQALGGWNRLFVSLALAVPATILAAAPGIATHSLARWNLACMLAGLAALAGWRARTAARGGLARLRRGSLRAPRPQAVPTLLAVLALAITWSAVLVPEGVENTGSGDPNGTIVYYHGGSSARWSTRGGCPRRSPSGAGPASSPTSTASR